MWVALLCDVRSQFVRLVSTERIATIDAVNIVVTRRRRMRRCVFDTELVSLAVRLDGLVTTATLVRHARFQCTLIALMTFIPSFINGLVILDFNCACNVAPLFVPSFSCRPNRRLTNLMIMMLKRPTCGFCYEASTGAREGQVRVVSWPAKIWSWGQKLHMALIKINLSCYML